MRQTIRVKVNGVERENEVEPRLLLVHYLRETLNLTGTHVGCDTGQCGACTVLMDGEAVKSCMVLAVQADGAKITTVEGLASGRRVPPDPEGFLGEARPAVRLLHAGHDDGRGRPARSATRTPPTPRSASSLRATSAAAPATRISSRPCVGRRGDA